MSQQENDIYRGDDWAAFGGKGITIHLINPMEYAVSKVIFVCGCIQKVYENPIFPLQVKLTSAESKRLNANNVCYLVAYDEQGRQKTCTGTLTFPAKNGVICNG
jgi:hypothetical protein